MLRRGRGSTPRGWAAFGTLLTAAAFLFLFVLNLSQVNYGILPEQHMAQVDVTNLGTTMQKSEIRQQGGLYFKDDLYGDKERARMGHSRGIRDVYRYGMHRSCGYRWAKYGQDKGTKEMCNLTSDHLAGYKFMPFAQIIADLPTNPANYKRALSDVLLAENNWAEPLQFRNDKHNGRVTRTASTLILLGTIIAFVVTLYAWNAAGCASQTGAPFWAAMWGCVVAAIFVGVGTGLWGQIVRGAADVNHRTYHGIDLGIKVSLGPSWYHCWGAFAILLAAALSFSFAAGHSSKPKQRGEESQQLWPHV